MGEKKRLFAALLKDVEEIVGSTAYAMERLEKICSLLREKVDYYDWVGFYLVEKEGGRELVLGPFAGEPTEHIRIPFGRGICGQAADRKETFVVQDVSKEANYLSCSLKVKSEIVVPILKSSRIVGEIDIDSHKLEPFSEEDREFLEQVAEKVAEIL